MIPGLAEKFRVVALDLYGFGYTERPRDFASYTREGQARGSSSGCSTRWASPAPTSWALTAPSRTPRETVDLAAIDVPALVVWGAEDEIIPLSLGRAAARRLPRTRIAVIEKAGHMPMEERPQELVRLLSEFLAGQSSRQD